MRRSGALVAVIVLLLSGCNIPSGVNVEAASAPIVTATVVKPTIENTPTEIPPEPTQTAIPQIVHKDIPGSPIGKILQTVHDQVDDRTAPQKQAFGGDDFKNGKYERPFDTDMNYLPLTDLVSVQLSREDPLWVYILYKVNTSFSSNPSADTYFMIEIDTDLDNRGNILIITGIPKSTEWSTESVKVLTNPDLNVGGINVVKPDSSLSEGRGYYEVVFDEGKGDDPDLAWSRLSKVNPAVAEIAFKNTLTGGEKGKFIWLPWSDAALPDGSLFEFNDHFTFEQAGYPLKEDAKNYPLKALWGVDNTCRIPSGFMPTGYMPGLCPNYDPSPSKGSSSNCVPTCVKVSDKITICTPC